MDRNIAEHYRGKLANLAATIRRPVRIMEVCGTHTFAIARHALRTLLPESVKLISGPGCPVCVSGPGFIEKIRTLVRQDVEVALFGDLLRIPGTSGTLQGEKRLHVVYSPEDALNWAWAHPEAEMVFAAVGFEPTLCAGAALLAQMAESGVKNFSMLADFKHIQPVMQSLSQSRNLDGFLLPGHVASVIGTEGFAMLETPGVVSGFEPEDILKSLCILLKMIAEGRKNVQYNNYPAAVQNAGNRTAQQEIARYFELAPSQWRGLGEISGSGWRIKDEFAGFDAARRYALHAESVKENSGCRCGEVLTGLIAPEACPLFGKACTPDDPVGACMSSLEGSCAAAYEYGEMFHA